VLAVGVTRGWRAALIGVAAALLALGGVVAVLGPSLIMYVPIDAPRLVVGVPLLIFGLQWLRKAILRAGGRPRVNGVRHLLRRQGVGIEWSLGELMILLLVLLYGLSAAVIVTALRPRRALPLAAGSQGGD